MPEFSYGVTRIRVTLDDGSRFNDVFVAWGSEIVRWARARKFPLTRRGSFPLSDHERYCRTIQPSVCRISTVWSSPSYSHQGTLVNMQKEAVNKNATHIFLAPQGANE